MTIPTIHIVAYDIWTETARVSETHQLEHESDWTSIEARAVEIDYDLLVNDDSSDFGTYVCEHTPDPDGDNIFTVGTVDRGTVGHWRAVYARDARDAVHGFILTRFHD